MATRLIEGVVLDLLQAYRYTVYLARASGSAARKDSFMAAGHSPIRSQNKSGDRVEFFNMLGGVVKSYDTSEVITARKG